MKKYLTSITSPRRAWEFSTISNAIRQRNEKICPSFSRFSLASKWEWAKRMGMEMGMEMGMRMGLGLGLELWLGLYTGPGVALMCAVPNLPQGVASATITSALPRVTSKRQKKRTEKWEMENKRTDQQQQQQHQQEQQRQRLYRKWKENRQHGAAFK